ncbi:hypothetical protein H634G_07894 [Metarhizium anisopliae BRIP 53293]|uniref:Cysteine-rich transmembrane CYSTM domain-containing protein n=1 Tax=Metarhizium anisopliae BRIP 53293 TaxID=1291518 RepID=A0A0D9NS14_METAN|nr:hypothetical protein H634G_07894 [Metarhizium anisopliae BRIP 53293]KJK85804.1 hypothetical protein H633G_10349 [Metarhizium anisopliae BRIP 53284]
MPATQQQMTQEPAPAVVPESRTSTEQPRPVEPMSADSMRLRGGGEEGEAICCGICAGLCCFECCECCC